jgi:hypothetical protein
MTMKLILAVLVLCLWPWTVKAQWDTKPDTFSTWVGMTIGHYQTDGGGNWNLISVDTAVTMSQVRRMIDSALAAQGRWEMRVELLYVNNGPPRDTSWYPTPCTTWVWVRPEVKP